MNDLFNGWPEDGEPVSDLIPTRDRIMALLSPPSQEVHLTVDDARWIKAEIERLEVSWDRLNDIRKELRSYLEEEREKNEKQVRMTMDAHAKIERLEAVVEHCAVERLCSKCAAALEGDDEGGSKR